MQHPLQKLKQWFMQYDILQRIGIHSIFIELSHLGPPTRVPGFRFSKTEGNGGITPLDPRAADLRSLISRPDCIISPRKSSVQRRHWHGICSTCE
jgi:hypothetical protein